MRQLLSGLLSILLALPIQVQGEEAAATSSEGGKGVSIWPWSPAESAPGPYGHIPADVQKIMAQIAALPAKVSASGGQLTMPSFPAAQKAAGAYASQRAICFADQARASMVCREETSPNLQSTLQGVNLVMSGINSLAVNDACKGFSKAMSVAQAGITAYTAACGLLRKKCNVSCTSAGTAFKALANYVVTQDESCAGTPPGMAECSAALTQIKSLKAQMNPMLSQDGSQSVEGTLHNKANLCQHTYGLLLASAGASILSLANSMKQGQQCDEESDATGAASGESTAVSPSTSTDSGTTAPVNTISNPELSAAQTGSNTVLDSGGNTGTAGTTDPVYTTPTTPVTSEGSGAGSTTPSRSVASPGGSGSASGLGSGSSEIGKSRSMGVAEGSASASSSSEMASGSSGAGSSSYVGSEGSSEFANSQYREYLPGGDKDPSRSVAGQEAWRKEVTGAGGKSNWTKMQERYKAVKTLNDD